MDECTTLPTKSLSALLLEKLWWPLRTRAAPGQGRSTPPGHANAAQATHKLLVRRPAARAACQPERTRVLSRGGAAPVVADHEERPEHRALRQPVQRPQRPGPRAVRLSVLRGAAGRAQAPCKRMRGRDINLPPLLSLPPPIEAATLAAGAARQQSCRHWARARTSCSLRTRRPPGQHDCHVARQERHGPPGVLDEAVRGDGRLDVRQRERRRRRQALAGLQAGTQRSGPRSHSERVTRTQPGSDIAFCSTRKERGTSMQEDPAAMPPGAAWPACPARLPVPGTASEPQPAGRGDPGQLDAAVRRLSAPHTQATNLVNSRGRIARRQRLRSRQRGRNGCHSHGPARPPAGRGSLPRRRPARQARQGAVPAEHAGAGGEHGRHGW